MGQIFKIKINSRTYHFYLIPEVLQNNCPNKPCTGVVGEDLYKPAANPAGPPREQP